MNISVVDLRS